MSKLNEKQMLIATIAGAAVLTLGFGVLTYMDYQNIYAAEITDSDPDAASIGDEMQWGERRKIQERQRELDLARAEAELIPKREQDVIVYREIVDRDSKILPDFDDVNNLATTITEFERLSGVEIRDVSGLNVGRDSKGKAIRTMPVKLRLSGDFDQLLKFINLFENLDRMINTTAFTVGSGGKRSAKSDPNAKVVHSVSLDLLTFIYSSDANIAKPSEISNYEKRKDDPVVQKLIRQQTAAEVDKYQLAHRVNRRDPLVDPRRQLDETVPGEGSADFETQKQIVDLLKFEVEILKEDVRQEQVYQDNKQYVQKVQIAQLIDRKVAELSQSVKEATPRIDISDLSERFQDEVVTPFDAIRAQRNLDPKVVVITKDQLLDFHTKMYTAVEEQKYKTAVDLLANFDSWVDGRELEPEAKELEAEMRSLGEESAIMIDFQALKLDITGMILRRAGSMVIANGTTLKEGDYVDPGHRCRLMKIEKEQLTFEFDGVEIVMPMDGK